MQALLGLKPHPITRGREQRRIDCRPRRQNPKVQPQPRVQVKQDTPARLDDIVQRPRVPPVVETRLDVNIVKRRRHICNHPEDEPQPRPRLSHYHGDVFAG